VPYTDHFHAADDLILHLDQVVPTIADPVLRTQYVGFLCVSVVTVFELCIKDVLVDFAHKKNRNFGAYCANAFERMNGRVSLKDLRDMHVKKFGEKYVSKFATKLDAIELLTLKQKGLSLKASYGNVIVWRNKFAHEGVLPANANYVETAKGYAAGREIIACLARAMVR
jgi:hypothetical protein